VQPYLFSFEDDAKAKRFVERLAHYLRDVAIFRHGHDVTVFDGSERGQHLEILRLAKASSATFHVEIDTSEL
jgi:hypothetical protein